MKKIKLTENDLEKIVNRVITESKSSKKKTIVVSESQLVESIERIIKEMMSGSSSLGFGNTGGMGMGLSDAIIKPTDKYRDLEEKEDLELDLVDDPDATEDGMGIFEKWESETEVESTGEYSDMTISQIDKEIKRLKSENDKYQEKGKKVPKKNREKMSELYFAKRAKQDWPKGKGSSKA